MNSNSKKNLRLLTLSAVFCAIVYVATTFVRIPVVIGYVHIGDAFIYLAAAMLPMPYALGVGAVGAGLADLIGYPLYAPGTIIIKMLMVLFFSSKKEKMLCVRNITAVVPAGIVCVGGYYLYEVILTKSFAAPVAGIVFNVAQAAASAVIFLVIGFTFDKMKLRDKIIK